MEFTSVWDDAGDAAQAAVEQHALTSARIACLGFQSFLTASLSEDEYGHREALATEKIEAAAAANGVSVEALSASLRADWVALAATRQVEAAQVIFHESYGNVSRPQLAAYRKHNISPSDHDDLADEFGEDSHDAITKAVKERSADGMYRHPRWGSKSASRLPFSEAVNEDDGSESDESPSCPRCGGPGVPLGKLGQRLHFRCRNCGTDFSHAAATSVKQVAVRHLAIVFQAGENPFAKDDEQDPPPDADNDGMVDEDPQEDIDLSQSNPGAYYVLDEGSNLDIGGPYASKADAQDAIEAGVFDSDSPTVQKGTVAENEGDQQDPMEEQDPEADPDADPAAEQDPADDGGNPFAKKEGAVANDTCETCGGKITHGISNNGKGSWTHAKLPDDGHKPTPKTAAASRLEPPPF